jgi:fructoselysine-6-P-deglycase FrlB-like protein
MGKPYATELDQLGVTYAWAASTDIRDLVTAVSGSATLPLLTIGSGGSLSAAYQASTLHEEHSGLLSKALTPLEIVRSSLYLGAHSLLLLSAGG